MIGAILAAIALCLLAVGGQQIYITHLKNQHEAYKSKVIAATLEAYQKADATTKAIAMIGEQRVTVYRDRVKLIERATNVQIDPSGVPDCRVSDGVRDTINSARSGANNSSTRRTEAGMSAAANDGRKPRESRSPRG